LSRVSVRYAKALFSLALDEKKLDNVANDINEIRLLIKNNRDFSNFVVNPLISNVKQVEIIKSIFSGKVEMISMNFLELICSKKRLSHMPEIVDAFDYLLLKHRNQLYAEVTSAVSLDSQQLASIKSNLEVMTDKSVILNTRKDAAIIGGFKVLIEGIIIDNSIQYQLMKLKERLIS
jgi:F-type H+-transporting ATPase subunit delta